MIKSNYVKVELLVRYFQLLECINAPLDNYGNTALMLAAKLDSLRRLSVTKALVSPGANVHYESEDSKTLLLDVLADIELMDLSVEDNRQYVNMLQQLHAGDDNDDIVHHGKGVEVMTWIADR